MLLSELERSGDPAERRAATAQLAELLRSASHPEEAAIYYRRLKGEFADEVCMVGKTGKQIVAELPADSAEVRLLAESTRWPTGAVKHDGGHGVQGMNFQRPMLIAWQGDRGPFFQTTTVLYDMQQQQIVGRDGMGHDKFRIPLSEAGQNRFGYQPNIGATAFVAARGHLLFVNLGNQLLALDTLRPMNAGSRVLWQQELFEVGANVFNAGQVQMRQVQLPWGQTRQIPQSNEQAVLGVVGPITDRCVCIARGRDLLALDPLTGANLWTWHGLTPDAEVFGDDDALIVAPRTGDEAVVLRTCDGQRLGSCNVPPIDRRGGYHGRRVLTWPTPDNAADKKVEIRLADPWKGQDIVLGEFADPVRARATGPTMKGMIVDDEALAVLEPKRRFRIVSLDGGRTVVDQTLPLDTDKDGNIHVDDIAVQATPGQYLLIVKDHQRMHPQVESNPYMPMNMPGFDGGVQWVSGSVLAFDRSTGKPSWSVPATVDRQYAVLDQGQELPVILFVKLPPRNVQQRGGEGMGSILCLDRRTGRAVLNEDQVPMQINNYHFSMSGDRQTNSVAVNISNHSFTLQFTDDPVPPEPPYQAKLALKAPSMGATTQSILNALRGAAGGADQDDDPNDGR